MKTSTNPDSSNATPCEQPSSTSIDENAPPLHLHPLRTTARLQGNSSQSSLTKVVSSRSRSSSITSNPTSRETSPCPSDIAGGFVISRASSTTSSIAGDMDSAINSGGMLINIDQDILLDRMGMDTSPTMNDSFSGSGNIKSMPCLNERMSEESLDDCHAFTSMNDSFSGSLTNIKLMPCLNERMSEESLDDCHAFKSMNDSFSGSLTNIKLMPCLNERMSEESLDDCHAFTDLKNVIRQIPSANAGSAGSDAAKSRDGSVTGGSILGDSSCLLGTLKEFEEELEEEESDEADEVNPSRENDDNGKDVISALSFEIKHKTSLNDTNLNHSCKDSEADHSE